jgi:hypothetical protein
MTPTLLPSLPPEGALAADRRSRIRARPWLGGLCAWSRITVIKQLT